MAVTISLPFLNLATDSVLLLKTMWNHINSISLTRTLSQQHKVKLRRRMYSSKQHNARKLTPCSYHFFVWISAFFLHTT